MDPERGWGARQVIGPDGERRIRAASGGENPYFNNARAITIRWIWLVPS